MSSVRLIQFTDLHLYAREDGALRGVPTLPSARAALAHAQLGAWPPDALLVTGDIVQDDPGGYAHFRRLFGALQLPVLCLPGNHDDPTRLREALAEAPFLTGGHLELGRWRILLLDSVVPGAAQGELRHSSLVALDAALAQADERPALVCLHHHPVPMHSLWLDQVGLANAEAFFAVIDRHPNVRGILWGHVHQSYDGLRNGVRLLGTPSTCAQFRPLAEAFELDPRPAAYRTLELHPDGTIVTDVVWVDAANGHGSMSAA
jgi:Icc protein